MQLHGSELKKGVVIERGASPWQIFQQNEQGFAVIRLSGTAHRCLLYTSDAADE